MQATCGSHHVIFTTVDSQITHKMADLGYPLSTANEMLYSKERHSLLLTCFKTFLICVRQIVDAYNIIYLPLVGQRVPFSTGANSQIEHKMLDFWYPISMANVIPYCKERYSLLMPCFITFVVYIYITLIRGASDSIFKPFVGLTILCHLSLHSTLKFHTKSKILVPSQ